MACGFRRMTNWRWGSLASHRKRVARQRPNRHGVALGILLWLAFLAAPDRAFAENESFDPPIFRSQGSQFTLLKPVYQAPAIPIRGLDESLVELASFRGRAVLLNFWATWCPPCVFEMPALDRLAARYPSDRFVVVAVSIDETGAQAVLPFVERNNLSHVSVYLDPGQNLGYLTGTRPPESGFALYGLPISYVIDSDGRVLGYLVGHADWDSPEADAFVEYLLQAAVR